MVLWSPGPVAGKSTKTGTAIRTWLLIALLRLYARILRKLLPTPYDDAIAASLIDEDAIEKIIREFTVITVQAQDIQRRTAAQHSQVSSEIFNFDGTARLTVSVMSPSAPWLKVPPEKCQTPAMITHEEAQYFTYIGRFYEGIGRAVELGPWLGASTHHIVLGLANNPKFAGERLHVFDDFVWRKSWMDPYVRDEEKLPDHACFRHLFDKYTTRVQHLVDVGLQVLFFLTPIFYPEGALAEHGLDTLIRCNPLTWLLRLLRGPILHNELPTQLEYLVCTSIVLAAAALAVWTLARLERRLIFRM